MIIRDGTAKDNLPVWAEPKQSNTVETLFKQITDTLVEDLTVDDAKLLQKKAISALNYVKSMNKDGPPVSNDAFAQLIFMVAKAKENCPDIKDAKNLKTNIKALNKKIVAVNKPSLMKLSDFKKLQTTGAALLKEVITLNKKISAARSKAIEVQCISANKDDFIGEGKKMAQALKMALRGDGRDGPKEEGVAQYKHIHVGGNAKLNLLFRQSNNLVLGVIDFHIESGNNKSQKAKVKKVAGASGSTTTLLVFEDDSIIEKT